MAECIHKLAGIPQNFQSISNVLPTYEYIDLAAGTGIINFFAGKTVDKNLLSNKEFYCDVIYTASSGMAVGVAKMLDIDFDVLLNRPLNVSGVTVLNVPVGLYNDTSPSTSTVYIIAKFRKWDGATETEICNNQSRTFTQSGNGTTFSMLAIDLTIPLTHFKIGEYMRLTIEAYGSASAGTGLCYVGHDPQNRSSTWDTSGAVPSKLVFQVPTRLNL